MDVFGAALGDAGQFLRDAAVAAAHELGVFEALAASPRTFDELASDIGLARGERRLRALVELLVGIGHLRRIADDRFASLDSPPARPDVPKEGWGLLADVIRNDKPLALPGGEHEKRMHAHLAAAGASAARELIDMLRADIERDAALGSGRATAARSPSLLDLGGGAGAYTAAFLDAFPNGCATLVDYAEVIALAREHLARFGDRVRFVVSDVRTIDLAHESRAHVGADDGRAGAGNDERAGDGGERAGSSAHVGAADDVRADASGDGRADFRAHVGVGSEGADERTHVGTGGGRASADERDSRAHVGHSHGDKRVDPRGGVARATVGAHDVVLLANVLHLHGERECSQLCAIAARATKPGGRVVVKDLRIDDDRSGPFEGLLFALNMAVYTGGGSVYSASQIRACFVDAGIEQIEERRFDVAPDAFAILGRRLRVPDEEAIDAEVKAIASQLSRVGKIAWRELEAIGKLRDGARPRHLVFPRAFGRRLASALVGARDEGRADEETAMRTHYLETLPRQRVAQIVGTDEPAATFMHTPLDWAQLPRMSAAIDRVFGVLADADVDAAAIEAALGARTADEFRASAPTFAELFMRMHYGACMPLLYGYPADLAYFAARARERGESVLATMDRYLTAPLVHELCHFGRERDALPTHLDECVGGWLGVHVWPEFAVPGDGWDDAIPYAPLLAQVGQAFARAFGVNAIVRAQCGAVPWKDVLGEQGLAMARALCDEDWHARRSLHFLADTMQPRPWVAFALAAGAGHSLSVHTLKSLGELDIGTLALRGDAGPAGVVDGELDRAIVCDGVAAMCLETRVVEGSLRTRFALPSGPIRVDAVTCRISCGSREYWLPPEVAGRMRAAGRATLELRLERREAIVDAVAAICG